MFATQTPPLLIDGSKIRPDIQALQLQLVDWRRQLHQKPELGFREQLTADFIHQRLTDWNIPHHMGVAKTGIVATIESHQPGPVIGIRADMDALPIQEENQVPYCSQHDGIMHACGHDGHVAIALGTAYYLANHRDHWTGSVKILFQPAEEGPGGAKPMIEAGALENPDVEAIIGLHLWNNLPLGAVGVRSGPLMAATEMFKITVQGKGGHGALPHQTVDSIVVGAQIVGALQTIVSRNIDPTQSAVVSVGKFHSGHAPNVIADVAELSGTVRYFDRRYTDFFAQRIEQIVAGICQSYGATYEFYYQALYPPVINDAGMADLVRSVALSVVETPAGIVPDCHTMGGEDMAFFLQEVPGCYFFLGSANTEKALAYPHHHPRFDFDETALGLGVEMFVRCIEAYATR